MAKDTGPEINVINDGKGGEPLNQADVAVTPARQADADGQVAPVVQPAAPVAPAALNLAPQAPEPMHEQEAEVSEENMALEHTDKNAPETTRQDATDMGVPMLQGDGSEPQGPEDALGPGPKRGDYRDRIGPSNYQPHQTVINADGKVAVEAQRPRAEDIGEVAGKKGGVETAEA